MAASYDHRTVATALLSVWLRAVASLYVTIFACALILFSSAPAAGQTKQFAYVSNGSTVAGYVLDPATGALTAIPAAPVVPRAAPGEMVLHPTGRFLYAISASNTVTAFSINQTTGALTELASSPYSTGGLSTPKGIAIDKTGRYVLVAGASLIDDSSGSISTYAVNQITGELTPLPTTSSLQLSPVGFVWSFVFNAFYYYGNYRNPNPVLPPFAAGGGFGIDTFTGTLIPDNRMGGIVGSIARTLAISPKGNYLFAGHGQYVGSIDSWVLSGPSFPSNSNLGINLFPTRMVVDAEEKFLYAVINQNPLIHGYSINATTGVLTELPFSPFIGIDGGLITGSVDPSGPFLYVPTGAGLKGYRIGLNGSLTPIPASPIPAGNMVIARAPGQPITGPVAALSSSSVGFGPTNVGSTSPPQQISLGNIGDQVLAITSIAIDNPPTDFSQANACPANLLPNATCVINISFTPSAQGTRSATLSVISNGGQQIATLSGFGGPVPPPPGPTVTLDRTVVDFPGTVVRATSQGPPVKITNLGEGTLTFSGVSISGPNAADFAVQSNGCTASVPLNGNCTVSASFTPTAVGFRSATLQLADNAANPHPILLRGNGNTPPFTVGPPAGAPPDATSASVTAGQTAQYSLQLAPDPDSIATVTVALSCSGAPAGATCAVPPSVTSTNGNITPFMVTVTTTARAGIVPPDAWPSLPALGGLQSAPLALLTLFVLLMFGMRSKAGPRILPLRRQAWNYAALALAVLALLAAAACGGGQSYVAPPPPPPTGTPPGAYTVIVTATSGSTIQQLPLTLIVR
jgi:hypothetical protein